jgi:hypothetical protein
MNETLLKWLSFTLVAYYNDTWNAHCALSYLHAPESEQNTAIEAARVAVMAHRQRVDVANVVWSLDANERAAVDAMRESEAA